MIAKKIVFILILAAALVSPAFADDDEIDRSPVYHVYSDVDLIPTTKLEYDRPRIVIKAIVPKMVSINEDEIIDDYNALVLNIIDEEADGFRQQVQANQDYQQSLAKSDVKNDVIIDFDSSILNTGRDNTIISLRFAVHGVISGMSMSYRKHRVFNYNLDTGGIIELSELFNADSNYLNVISSYTRTLLAKKLKDKSKIEMGTAPTEDNYKNWNLTPDGLRFTFDRSQVAPAIYGAQVVTVPYSLLTEVINPDSLLGRCLKRKRCFSNNVVTGGFIDEAHNKKTKRVMVGMKR